MLVCATICSKNKLILRSALFRGAPFTALLAGRVGLDVEIEDRAGLSGITLALQGYFLVKCNVRLLCKGQNCCSRLERLLGKVEERVKTRRSASGTVK